MIRPSYRPGPVVRLKWAAIGAAALGFSAFLGACSQQGETNTEHEIVQNLTAAPPIADGNEVPSGTAITPRPILVPTPSPASPLQTSTGEGTVGGDGSAIQLSALTEGEINLAKLEGELACSFAGLNGAPLLHATGNVGSSARSFGVVKVLDSVETISAPGGFNGMVRGATFAGRGKTVRITRLEARRRTGVSLRPIRQSYATSAPTAPAGATLEPGLAAPDAGSTKLLFFDLAQPTSAFG